MTTITMSSKLAAYLSDSLQVGIDEDADRPGENLIEEAYELIAELNSWAESGLDATVTITAAPIMVDDGESACASDDDDAHEWSGSPCPIDPDNYWINDKTGERIAAVDVPVP